MRPKINRIDWTRSGYFAFPILKDRSPWISEEDTALWREFETILWSAQHGRFDQVEKLIDLYDDTESWILASAYRDLLGDAGTRSCFDRIIPVVENGMEPTYAVELGEALGSWGSLCVVPVLLSALDRLEGFADAHALAEILSRLLESEPGPIADKRGLDNLAEYRAVVSRRHAELASQLGSHDLIVLHGAEFSVVKLTEQMISALADTEFHPYMRRKFEANTGIDCSTFYAQGILQPLAAAAILEDFLDSGEAEKYEAGVRYFFGHRIPDD